MKQLKISVYPYHAMHSYKRNNDSDDDSDDSNALLFKLRKAYTSQQVKEENVVKEDEDTSSNEGKLSRFTENISYNLYIYSHFLTVHRQ